MCKASRSKLVLAAKELLPLGKKRQGTSSAVPQLQQQEWWALAPVGYFPGLSRAKRHSFTGRVAVLLFAILAMIAPLAHSLEKQPAEVYRARRAALAAKLHGGVAVLFAAQEPLLDFEPYRQDADFYYLTGWNEPGAALLIAADEPKAATPRSYSETLFLPTRNLRLEKYTGAKLDADTPDAARIAGVDAVEPMTALPVELNRLIDADRRLAMNIWAQPEAPQAKAALGFTRTTLGMDATSSAHDVTDPCRVARGQGRGRDRAAQKGERCLHSGAAGDDQGRQAGRDRARSRRQNDGRVVRGRLRAASYAPIVGSGINSTTLHYSENTRTLEDGDVLLVDAACEYSMYASDITRTLPVNGHFTARQREIYNIVLGAQQAAIDAFVAGKSKINDRDRRDPDSLDNAAYNYINTHGKSLDGKPLGQYWLHGLGHMVGIDVHDPAVYPALLKPGMVFTIEPGVYIPEEKIGVRIECVFLVGADGKLIDLVAALPHTAEDVEAAMQAK